MRNLLKVREMISLLIVIALFILVGLYRPTFLAMNNIFQTLNGSVVYALVSLGMCYVLFIGEIDISVGANLGLTAAIAGLMTLNNYPLIMIILTVTFIGLVIGLVNAVGVLYFKIPSIIMTLGSNGIIRGLIFLVTQGRWVEGLPPEFKGLSQIRVFNTLSLFYLFVLLLAVGLHFMNTSTLFGKSFKATGDNLQGAQLIGISVVKTKAIAFVICAVATSIAGVLFASRVGFITPSSGVGYEMTAIAACVIGGVSLSGGVGSVWGGIIGALLMSSISRVLVFIGLPSTFNDTITGLLLIIIVVVNATLSLRSNERARIQRLEARVE